MNIKDAFPSFLCNIVFGIICIPKERSKLKIFARNNNRCATLFIASLKILNCTSKYMFSSNLFQWYAEWRFILFTNILFLHGLAIKGIQRK